MRERKRKLALCLLLQCGILLHCGLFGGHMRLAWWSTLYPQSLYETGIVGTDDDTEDDAESDTEDSAVKEETAPVHIRFRLVEWLEALLAD